LSEFIKHAMEIFVRLPFAHDSHADEIRVAPFDGHGPGKSLRRYTRSKIHFHAVRLPRRKFELRRVEKRRRKSQAEFTLQSIVGAAGDDASASAVAAAL